MTALETKVQNILEKVAPMEVKKLAYRGKPRWITKELESLMKERKQKDRKAKQSRLFEDELDSRRVRNNAAKEIKNAKTNYLKTKLKNLTKNSSTAWDAVNDYLGWRKKTNCSHTAGTERICNDGGSRSSRGDDEAVQKERKGGSASTRGS